MTEAAPQGGGNSEKLNIAVLFGEMNAVPREDTEAKREFFARVGQSLGSDDQDVAETTATFIMNLWIPELEWEEDTQAWFGLRENAGLVKGSVAGMFISEALRRIATPPVRAMFGNDRRVLESGYKMLACLLGSNDYDTALGVYQYLHTGISGGEPLDVYDQALSMWFTDLEFGSGPEERPIWQGFRDVTTCLRLTRVTQDCYRALQRNIDRCPHPDIQQSGMADVAEYEALIRDFNQRGVYVQFD